MHRSPMLTVVGCALHFIVSSAWIPIADAGPLHDAVKANDQAAVESLAVGGADINESDFVLGTPLHVAVAQGNLDLAKRLIGHMADLEAASERDEAKAVHLAANFGDVDMLRLLLDSGADIDARDKYGQTPLHQAALTGNLEAARLLLDMGAGIDLKDSRYGATPLSIASLNGRMEVVKLLVSSGADIEARTHAGRTVLRLAATGSSWARAGDGSLIEYLVSKGADINAKDDTGLTILGFADLTRGVNKSYSEVADKLRQLGAK